MKVGRDLISTVTDAVIDDVRAWQQRPLDDVYPVVFLDCLVLKIREGGSVQVIGRYVLTENGHMSFSPVDTRWLLSDTYPDSQTNMRILFLYDMHEGGRYEIGEFYAPPGLKKENRCDLHPRWKSDGSAVCIDSVHEGARQMYVIDVSQMTSAH